MNLLDYKCLGFSSFTAEKFSRYSAFHEDNVKLLAAKKRNIRYYNLPLSGGKTFFLDLLFEVRIENGHAQFLDFIPDTYMVKDPPVVCNPEWIQKSFWEGLLRVCHKSADLSFHMRVPTIALMPKKVDHKKQYYCSVACYAQQIDVFSSEESFKEKFEFWDVQSVAYPPVGIKDPHKNGLIINGILKYVEEAINPITEEPFYYLVIESMGQLFHAFASAFDLEAPPEVGNIVSVFGLMNGLLGAEAKGQAHHYFFDEPLSQTEFNFTIKHIISKLRGMANEHLVADVAGMQLGHLQYVQTIRPGKKYIVEIGLMRGGEIYLLRSKEMTLEDTISIFETILVEKLIPNMATWKDISKIF